MRQHSTPVNVLSPARAKGLEFGRVVLYMFGSSAPGSLLTLLDKSDQGEDFLLPYEYFVNQLYVAASRPKRRLFIIEDQRGRDDFWKIANDKPVQQKIWNKIPDGKKTWSEHVGGFEIGSRESWGEHRGDPEENAKRYERQGMSNRDPFMLRSAAQTYENLGQSMKALKLRAYAFRFEEQFLDAGETFERAGVAEEALTCYWTAGVVAKNRILELHKVFPEIGTCLEYRLIEALGNPSPKTITALLSELAQRVKENDALRLRLLGEPTFKNVVGAYGRSMLDNNSSNEQFMLFLASCEVLRKFGLAIPTKTLGEVYYRAGQYDKAVESWESGDGYNGLSNYKDAKTIVLAEKFEQNPEIPLSSGDQTILVEHFFNKGRHALAVRCLVRTGTPHQILDSIGKIPDDCDQWQALILEIVNNLAERNEWSAVLSLALASTGSSKGSVAKTARRVAQKKAAEIRNAIVSACVSYVEFSNQNNSLLKDYSDYFKAVVISSFSWRGELTVQAVGAAIERAGRQIDALQFYEQVMRVKSLRKTEREFAQKRWVVTKKKQAKRESEAGHEQAAIRYERDAEDKRREYGLTDARLADLPNVDNVWVKKDKDGELVQKQDEATEPNVEPEVPEEPESPPEAKLSTQFEIGTLRFEYSSAQQRVNITSIQTMDTANIRADVRQLRSSDVDVRTEDGSFFCDSWGIECNFTELNGTNSASLRFQKLGLTLVFEFAGGDG